MVEDDVLLDWRLTGGGIHNGLTIQASRTWKAHQIKASLKDQADIQDVECSAVSHSVSLRKTGRSWSVYVRCLNIWKARLTTTTGLLSIQPEPSGPDSQAKARKTTDSTPKASKEHSRPQDISQANAGQHRPVYEQEVEDQDMESLECQPGCAGCYECLEWTDARLDGKPASEG